MHTDLTKLRHHHVFQAPKPTNERRAMLVFALTIVTMTAEIVVGWFSGSMALFADGWHMGTHAVALGLAALAYAFARRHAHDHRYTFGTWKIEILGAYTSAIVLGIVGLSMILMSVERLFRPERIGYDEALIVAVIGLLVNVVSVVILSGGSASHDHHDGMPGHDHHRHSHQDLNLRSALVHVMTDALTSLLAIAALLGAKFFGWNFLDPVMGLVGAALILLWTRGLLRDTSAILLDKEMDAPIVAEIRRLIEMDGVSRVVDLHVWRVAQNKYACIAVIARPGDHTIEDYKKRLADISGLVHVTTELHRYSPP